MSALRKRRERDAAKVASVRKHAGSPLADRTQTGKPRKKGGGPRPDAERLIEVERLYLELRPSGVIVREITKRFGVEERTVYNDLTRVRAEYAPTDEERKSRRDQHRATLVELRDAAKHAGDLELVRKVVADLAKLDGLNEPDKVEHSGEIRSGVLVLAAQPPDAQRWAAEHGSPAEQAPEPAGEGEP